MSVSAKNKENFGTLPRGEWENLETVGDVKRFLRSVILRTENEEMDPKVASVLGQLTSYLLKCIESGDLMMRLAKIEEVMKKRQAAELGPRSPLNGHAPTLPVEEVRI